VRNTKILIRLNDAEKRLIDTSAESEGLASATWARNQLLKAARQEIISNPAPEVGEQPSRPNLLSLFCGAGGLDEGFRRAGFHDKNFGDAFAPIGVIGGPPCQSFSHSNVHQSKDDPRHKLPEAYASLLTRLNKRHPISFFVFENVPGLLGKKHIARYERFRDLFKRAGFSVHETVLDAKDFGVPQERKRVFIIGFNRVLHPGAEWNEPDKVDQHVTVRDTIEGLPEPVFNDRGLDPETFPVHPNHWCLVPRSRKFTNGMLEEGQAWGRSFRTLYWDKPSWAVAYGHREVHVHPNGHRRLSIYEAMRLQTFPDEYRLTGNMTAQIQLVSDAVPVKLAEALALAVRSSLSI
jgi:DNA (cytosine-5)-methyltransferase 1